MSSFTKERFIFSEFNVGVYVGVFAVYPPAD